MSDKRADTLTGALVALHDAAVAMLNAGAPTGDYRAFLRQLDVVCVLVGADYDVVLDTVLERSRVALNGAQTLHHA